MRRVAAVYLLPCLALAASTPASAQWQPLAPGIDYRALPNREGQAFRLDLRRVDLRVAEADPEHGRQRAAVSRLARGSGAVLAVNGGYFTDANRPLGLLMSGGQQLNPLRRADWGVLTVDTRRRAHLVHTRDYRARSDTDFAIQAGPRLVVAGKPLTFRPQVARRTALGIGRDDHSLILVVLSRPVLTARLADLMAGLLRCRYALNLDGGSSTQLWSAYDTVDDVSGLDVANAVLVVPR